MYICGDQVGRFMRGHEYWEVQMEREYVGY